MFEERGRRGVVNIKCCLACFSSDNENLIYFRKILHSIYNRFLSKYALEINSLIEIYYFDFPYRPYKSTGIVRISRTSHTTRGTCLAFPAEVSLTQYWSLTLTNDDISKILYKSAVLCHTNCHKWNIPISGAFVHKLALS